MLTTTGGYTRGGEAQVGERVVNRLFIRNSNGVGASANVRSTEHGCMMFVKELPVHHTARRQCSDQRLATTTPVDGECTGLRSPQAGNKG